MYIKEEQKTEYSGSAYKAYFEKRTFVAKLTLGVNHRSIIN